MILIRRKKCIQIFGKECFHSFIHSFFSTKTHQKRFVIHSFIQKKIFLNKNIIDILVCRWFLFMKFFFRCCCCCCCCLLSWIRYNCNIYDVNVKRCFFSFLKHLMITNKQTKWPIKSKPNIENFVGKLFFFGLCILLYIHIQWIFTHTHTLDVFNSFVFLLVKYKQQANF